MQQALGVRAALESSGLDHGPISLHDRMCALGLDSVPSVASLARIFREAGVARLEPRKSPVRPGDASSSPITVIDLNGEVLVEHTDPAQASGT